jgi:hypothetical protein
MTFLPGRLKPGRSFENHEHQYPMFSVCELMRLHPPDPGFPDESH